MPELPREEFLAFVEQAIQLRGIKASSLGRGAVNDPNFVRSLRSGRHPRAKTQQKVRQYIEENATSAG